MGGKACNLCLLGVRLVPRPVVLERLRLTMTPRRAGLLLSGWFLSLTATAQEGADLAKQFANPIAALISVPVQLNYDEDIGL